MKPSTTKQKKKKNPTVCEHWAVDFENTHKDVWVTCSTWTTHALS